MGLKIIEAIGAIAISAIGSQMRSRTGSPQIDSEIRVIGARLRVSPNSRTIAIITDRMAAGPLLILLKGIGPLIKLEQGMIAAGGQEETAAGCRRRSSSSAAPKAYLPRGSLRSRAAGGPKGEGMIGSP